MDLIRNLATITPRGVSKMWQRNMRAFRSVFWVSMVPTFVGPLILMVSLGLGIGTLVHQVDGLTYQQFIAPGLLASSAMLGATYSCTYDCFVRLKYQRVYDAILATPLNIGEIVTGELAWGATRGLFGAGAFLLIISLFGLVKSPLALLTLPLLFLVGLMFAVLGMVFTAVVSDVSLFTHYFTMIVTPLFLFSGIFFPVQNLPAWAEGLIEATPLIHGVRATRYLLNGQLTAQLGWDLVYILGVTIVFFLVSFYLMRRRVVS
jgi:lipooligosaccharide transport system permease protein